MINTIEITEVLKNMVEDLIILGISIFKEQSASDCKDAIPVWEELYNEYQQELKKDNLLLDNIEVILFSTFGKNVTPLRNLMKTPPINMKKTYKVSYTYSNEHGCKSFTMTI